MFTKPIPHPRDLIIATLEMQQAQFLAAGHKIQAIPSGISGQDSSHLVSAQQRQMQKERAKLAPALRKHAAAGKTVEAAASALKIKLIRAQLIATENNIQFNMTASRSKSLQQ